VVAWIACVETNAGADETCMRVLGKPNAQWAKQIIGIERPMEIAIKNLQRGCRCDGIAMGISPLGSFFTLTFRGD
jgi:hypothetical protein